MASRTLSAAVFLLSLLALSAVSTVHATTCTQPTPPKPTPKPKPKPKPKPHSIPIVPPAKCPVDTLKLGTCADLLGLGNVVVRTPPTSPCCAVLEGLADLEAALCLCTAIKANILGMNIDVPVALSTISSACQKPGEVFDWCVACVQNLAQGCNSV